MNYHIENNQIRLTGNTFEHRDYLKSIGFRSKYKAKKFKYWYCDLNIDVVEDLQKFCHNGVNGNIKYLLDDPDIAFIYLEKHGTNENDIKFNLDLYEHQEVSAGKGMANEIMYDGSEPGTGKTRVQIELMLQRNEWPVLAMG